MGTLEVVTRWPERAPLGGLAPRRRLFVLIMAGIVLAVAVLVGVSVAREYAVPPQADPAVMGPVVLVPGYGGNTDAPPYVQVFGPTNGWQVTIDGHIVASSAVLGMPREAT